LTKRVVEAALDGEMDDHLGYGKHDPVGRDGGNCNGRRAKMVLTEAGPVPLEVPRDRDGSFEPQLVRKRQRRLTGLDDLVISLSAKGLTHGEIAAHLAEKYGAQVYEQTITTLTDRVIEGTADLPSSTLIRAWPTLRGGRETLTSGVVRGLPSGVKAAGPGRAGTRLLILPGQRPSVRREIKCLASASWFGQRTARGSRRGRRSTVRAGMN
jgi:hypothetical protein